MLVAALKVDRAAGRKNRVLEVDEKKKKKKLKRMMLVRERMKNARGKVARASSRQAMNDLVPAGVHPLFP